MWANGAMLKFILCLAALSHVAADDPEDSPIVLAPPGSSTKNTALLVWVPGGLVPNHFYVPLMRQLQADLVGKFNLWVAVASCPGLRCIPGVGNPNVTNALNAGRKASKVKAVQSTWLGGHSLGGEQADNVCLSDNATTYSLCLLWGSFIFSGPPGMLTYPIPVLTITPELDYGLARASKMAPYWSAANAKGEAQMLRTPVIMLPDVDHSDMCQGFQVPGDLPSALSPSEAVRSITNATASFILSQTLKDVAATSYMRSHIEFTQPLMKPLVDALDLDLRSTKWCSEMQKKLAGPFASKIAISGSYFPAPGPWDKQNWPAPSAKLSQDGTVAVNITVQNAYEDDGGLWPPGPHNLGAPLPMRDTALSMGCRLISQTKIAALLGTKAEEPQNFCRAANTAAWEWALQHAPSRVIKRYHSANPCNSCAPGVPVILKDDTVKKSGSKNFLKLDLGYNLSNASLIVQSPEYVSPGEHSCFLFSPARALDFLYLDAYSASCYGGNDGSSANSAHHFMFV